MNEDKLMSKSPKTIKRRGLYATLAGGLVGVFSAVTFGLVATPKNSSNVKVSLHPQAVSRKKRG